MNNTIIMTETGALYVYNRKLSNYEYLMVYAYEVPPTILCKICDRLVFEDE